MQWIIIDLIIFISNPFLVNIIISYHMTNKFVVLLLLATLTVQQIQMQYQPINLESYYKIPDKLSYNKPLVFSPIGLEGGQSTWSQIFALSPPKITCSNGYFLLNERCNAPKIY